MQQTIAVNAHLIDLLLHLVRWQAEHDQGVGGEHQARLQ
jgi:hypothetical protein